MDFKLRGKRALVTGSTQGIGFAIAQGLAREGAAVVVNGRGEAKVKDAVKRLVAETKASVTGIAGDVGSAAEVERLVAQLGPVDILINNAGIFEPKPFLEISDRDWIRHFEVNVMSGVRLSRALLPHMLKQNWGRIIFISSEVGAEHPGGDGAIRHDQDRAARCLARHRRNHSRDRRNGQRGVARADADGRRECVSGDLGQGSRHQRG